MNCLRCGYCCIKSAVIIVDNPDLGPVEGNLVFKDSDETCRHFMGNKPGEYSCAIHDREWYPETPCFAHGQIEHKPSDCRMGAFIISTERKPYNMSKELRDIPLAFKVSGKEKKLIEKAAKRQGMDTSNYIRWKLLYKDKEGGGGQ